MYRILSASKDTYITDKYIGGERSTTSNVGQAGTVDFFKLYDETYVPGVSGVPGASGSVGPSGSIIEKSRVLIKFDYSELVALTSSILDFSSGSFRAKINLKDVYGGQTTPSNFTLEVFPLSKSFDEGRGSDVVAFRDLDSANWFTASLSPIVTWSQPGAGASGSLGDDVDIVVSGNLGSGVVALSKRQTFNRGDEDLCINVTDLVSASLAGIIPNHGFRISFIDNEENDQTTRFVKRFGTRHALNKSLRPFLSVEYNDAIEDPGNKFFFDVSSSVYTYNRFRGNERNFFSGSDAVIGADSLLMELVASKSIKFTTSSFSPSHSASITYTTRSVTYFSASYTGSQFFFGTLAQTGVYYAPFNLSLVENNPSGIKDFISGSQSKYFDVFWKSLDGTVTYSRSGITLLQLQGSDQNAMDMNLVVNMTNLKDQYNSQEIERIRVFAADYNQELPGFKVPVSLDSVTIPDMRWRVIKAFSKEIVIPWSESTKMSTDRDGMYFDFYFKDLPVNEVYEFELLCVTDIGRDLSITNRGFRFKVIP